MMVQSLKRTDAGNRTGANSRLCHMPVLQSHPCQSNSPFHTALATCMFDDSAKPYMLVMTELELIVGSADASVPKPLTQNSQLSVF